MSETGKVKAGKDLAAELRRLVGRGTPRLHKPAPETCVAGRNE